MSLREWQLSRLLKLSSSERARLMLLVPSQWLWGNVGVSQEAFVLSVGLILNFTFTKVECAQPVDGRSFWNRSLV